MCLQRLSDRPKELTEYKLRVGWKAFFKDPKSSILRWAVMYHNKKLAVPVGRWLVSRKKKCTFSDTIAYKPRFHVYLRKPSLGAKSPFSKDYTITKVKFREPVATGYDKGLPTVVATKLFVMKGE